MHKDKKWDECNKKDIKRKKEIWTNLTVQVDVVALEMRSGIVQVVVEVMETNRNFGLLASQLLRFPSHSPDPARLELSL
jgi:hypothetical protein